MWKLGGFLTYNFVALTGMLFFVRHYVRSRWNIKSKNKKNLTIKNIVTKGSIYGLTMTGLYLVGLGITSYFFMPLSVFYKHCELQ